jgi:hypothetical protein
LTLWSDFLNLNLTPKFCINNRKPGDEMKNRHFLFLTVLTVLLIGVGSSFGDVWVPPVGQMVADSINVHLNITDDSTVVDYKTILFLRKLVSDDYNLNFTRHASLGQIDTQSVNIEFSDSLGDLQFGDQLFTFSANSHATIEETLRVAVQSRIVFDRFFSILDLSQYLFAAFENQVWWPDIGISDSLNLFVNVTANRTINLFLEDRLLGSDRNLDVQFHGFEQGLWGDGFSFRLEVDGSNGNHYQVSDSLAYTLTPETRAETPGIIKIDDVRINLSSYGIPENQIYYYDQNADILLNAELADRLAPMWLWYPNDETDAVVCLEGMVGRSIWGYYDEYYQRDSLTIRKVNVDGAQKGFFIFVPWMRNLLEGQDDWWWIEPHLRVEISDQHVGESARFILITAPTDPSRIRFSISDQLQFNSWSSPFDSVKLTSERDIHVLTFSGFCRSTGIALVEWGPNDVLPEADPLPTDLSISAFPNPFNSSTTISFSVPQPGFCSISVLDINGREVERLDEEWQEAGKHEIVWNARVGAGVYFIRLITPQGSTTGKVILVR